MERSSRRRNLTYLEVNSAPAVMKRQFTNPSAVEALDMEPLANNSKTPWICLPCHYTCGTCSGPHNSQCISCLDDAVLVNVTDVELKHYCYPNVVIAQMNNDYEKTIAILVVSILVFILIVFCVATCILKRKNSNYNSNINVAYNKLSTDDKYQSAIEIEEEIHKALKQSSDSESEDDMHL